MSLDDIRAGIAKACTAASRKPADVTLIAVSKNRSADDILPLLENGQRAFGENRIQEAADKWPDLRAAFPDTELHFIGQLQSNKAKDAVRLFDVLHTIDRPSVAEAVAKEMDKQDKHLPCFIQVNTGEEPQKGGVTIAALDSFYTQCTQDLGLNIMGLMCIPPAEDVPDLHFALLHKHAARLGLKSLSMGMSGDYDRAIRYEASHIRIGAALFDVMGKNK